MAVNLIREARVFFTTNVNTDTGKIKTAAEGGFSSTNTFEFQVLDGLSFSQNTSTETVSINESGTAPVRGQRVFNTALEPVDFSFSTYMRPAKVGTKTSAEEKYLWNAFASKYAIGVDATGDAADGAWIDGAAAGTNPATLDFSSSNYNQLQQFGIIISMVGSTILLHNCALESVTMDFGIDAIATLAWTGKATEFEQADAITFTTATAGVQTVTTGPLGTATVLQKITADSAYLANKLSTATITYPKTGVVDSKEYSLPITGGTLTISNNLTYLTPATVGVVNKPLTHFTGPRTYSGSLTAYLRRGATNSDDTGALFSSILSSATSDDQNQAEVKLIVGGTGSTGNRVELYAPTAMLAVPNIATEQIVSTTFGFTPQGSTSIESTDELEVKYYHSA